MKTFAVLCALAISAPVFACPNSDHDQAPRTAKKKTRLPRPSQADRAAEGPDREGRHRPDTDKAKDTQKKPDKVSSK